MNPGGFVGGTTLITLDDDECVIDRDGSCQRRDDRHHYAMVETRRIGDLEPRYVRGYCHHRHTVPVESTVDGETLARLCLGCDSQLPA